MKIEPRPTRTIVQKRGTEPFSGLPMLWVGGLLPDMPFDPTGHFEVYFDGVAKTWVSLRQLDPAGSAFDLQVIDEPGVKSVRVELQVPGDRETLAEQLMAEVYQRTAGGVPVPPLPREPTR